jgi:hypothetical protein
MPYLREDLKNKIVLVTGATSGIGEACARAFAELGCKLIITGRQVFRLQNLASDLMAYGCSVYFYSLDVTQKSSVQEFINNLPEAWKNIDILINNAGLALGLEPLQEGNIEDWDTMIDTNVKGLLYVTRQIVPWMMERQKGHVINIGSLAGIAVYPNGTVYCASKAAVKTISDGLRMDLVHTPIRVTNIQPGLVDTNFSITRFHGDRERAERVYKGLEPLNAEDIADIVVYVASAPKHVQIAEITVMPTQQASSMVIHRKLK